MDTPFNPDKWDWDELIVSEDGEEIQTIRVSKVLPSEQTEGGE
jgi:hypothetical protein